MNLVLSSPTWLVAMLMVLLVAAGIEDVLRFRISNLTSASIFVGAIVAMALAGSTSGLWENVLVLTVILAIGTGAFAAGMLGGGDVKLLAVVGLWLDFSTALAVIAATAVFGGVVALIYISARVLRRRSEAGIRGSKVPYGLAIVSGALFVFGLQLTQQPPDPLIDRLGIIRFHR